LQALHGPAAAAKQPPTNRRRPPPPPAKPTGAAPAAIPRQDWIGLRQIGERGGLFFESAPGEHMQFTLEWFREEVVRRWLGGEPSQRRRG
jgi:hypothetical protein